MTRMSSGARSCPHIGTSEDPSSHTLYPSLDNRCYHCRRPATPMASHQQRYCLGGEQSGCPAYVQRGDQAFPPDLMMRRQAFGAGFSSKGLFLSIVLVLILSLLVAFWLSPPVRALVSNLVSAPTPWSGSVRSTARPAKPHVELPLSCLSAVWSGAPCTRVPSTATLVPFTTPYPTVTAAPSTNAPENRSTTGPPRPSATTTAIPEPTPTVDPTKTSTPLQPTNTSLPLTPTVTDQAPTPTTIPTNTQVPSATPISTDTAMSTDTEAPSAIPLPSSTRVPTGTPVPGATPLPTNTPKPSPTPKPTNTPKPAPTLKPTPTHRPTNTPKPTSTPGPTPAAGCHLAAELNYLEKRTERDQNLLGLCDQRLPYSIVTLAQAPGYEDAHDLYPVHETAVCSRSAWAGMGTILPCVVLRIRNDFNIIGVIPMVSKDRSQSRA